MQNEECGVVSVAPAFRPAVIRVVARLRAGLGPLAAAQVIERLCTMIRCKT
jgi:hypothetical protein